MPPAPPHSLLDNLLQSAGRQLPDASGCAALLAGSTSALLVLALLRRRGVPRAPTGQEVVVLPTSVEEQPSQQLLLLDPRSDSLLWEKPSASTSRAPEHDSKAALDQSFRDELSKALSQPRPKLHGGVRATSHV